MNWREYSKALPLLPDNPTLEQWRDAVAKSEAMLDQVDEADRHMARRILGDTLIQAGAFMGFIDPEGDGLADDLIGDDPIPDDVERFDEKGHAIPETRIDAGPAPHARAQAHLLTVEEFQTRLFAELNALGETPASADVIAAGHRLQALTPPPGADFEGLLRVLAQAKKREGKT